MFCSLSFNNIWIFIYVYHNVYIYAYSYIVIFMDLFLCSQPDVFREGVPDSAGISDFMKIFRYSLIVLKIRWNLPK